MAQQKKAAAKKTTVKSPGMKVRSERDVPKYFSDKDTKPINDVTMWVEGKEKIRKGLTEDEKIAQRVSLPFRVVPNFKKDNFERKELARLKSEFRGDKTPHGSSTGEPKVEFASRLIIHLPNPSKNNLFKTTHSFTVTPSELPFILGRFIDKEQGKYITKYYYRGEKFELGKTA